MPFIGINPPTNRVQGLYGGASNVSSGSAPLNNIVDASAQAIPGLVAWYKDSFGRISVLAYAQAQASIPYGAALAKVLGVATTLNSAGVSTQNGLDCGFVMQASTGAAFSNQAYGFGGVAAASVINTGYFFWRYISGFVPNAKCGSSLATGVALFLCPSTAGTLSKGPASFNAATISASAGIPVGFMVSTGDTADGSVASVYLTGWYA